MKLNQFLLIIQYRTEYKKNIIFTKQKIVKVGVVYEKRNQCNK